MRDLIRSAYEGEDRETTLDWFVVNVRREECVRVRLKDGALRDAEILETHGIASIDSVGGIAACGGIAPNGVLHVSARVRTLRPNAACTAALTYADRCILLRSDQERG